MYFILILNQLGKVWSGPCFQLVSWRLGLWISDDLCLFLELFPLFLSVSVSLSLSFSHTQRHYCCNTMNIVLIYDFVAGRKIDSFSTFKSLVLTCRFHWYVEAWSWMSKRRTTTKLIWVYTSKEKRKCKIEKMKTYDITVETV